MYFVISGYRNTNLQELVHVISIENKGQGSFEVFILFFDDICQHLTLNSNLIKKYWQSFFDIVPKISNRSILTNEDAFNSIINLNEFQLLARIIEKASSGEVNLNLRIEGVPNLETESDVIKRSWQIAISENHKTYQVTLWRFAVNVDDGTIYFYSIIENEWFSREQWKEKEFFDNA